MLEVTQITANIAGVVAAIGVMISLIYGHPSSRQFPLGQREHQSPIDGRGSFFLEVLVKDPELAGLVLRGYAGEELNDIDRFRFETWARMTIEAHMTFFVLLERGTVTGEIFEYWSHSFDRLTKLPAFVDVYKKMREDLKPSFREHMDNKTPPEFGLHEHSNKMTDSTNTETVSHGTPA